MGAVQGDSPAAPPKIASSPPSPATCVPGGGSTTSAVLAPELSPAKVSATGSSTRTNSAPAGDFTLNVKPGVVWSSEEVEFWPGGVGDAGENTATYSVNVPRL